MDVIKQNITHNILEIHVTFLSYYFSICTPLAAITLSSPLLKLFSGDGTFLEGFWPVLAQGTFSELPYYHEQ